MSIGARIRAERERLGYTQEAFAALGGAAKQSQIGWEQDRTRPNASVLAGWADAGADVLFVITGQRSSGIDPSLLGMCESALNEAYARARPSGRSDGVVRLSALSKVYNAVQPRLNADAEPGLAVRAAAAEYIAWIDDPSDSSLLERALFREPGGEKLATVVKADRSSIASGRDTNIGSGRKK